MTREEHRQKLTDEALDAVRDELDVAVRQHGPMHSAHEGYAVILKEVRELEREVFRKIKNRDALIAEATQVAAMAVRFLVDVMS